MLRRTLAVAAAFAVVTAGCFIATDNLEGKGCDTDADCPENVYVCVPTLDGARKVCEVIFPPVVPPRDAGVRDAGPPDAGVLTPFYCTSVKAMLDRTCVSNCHGAEFVGSGDQSFRLDIYEGDGGAAFFQKLPDGGKGPAVLGAKGKAERAMVRIIDPLSPAPMPPLFPPGLPKPTAAERGIFARWLDAGTPFCNPSVTP